MATHMQWADAERKKQLVGEPFQDEQVLVVSGDGEKEFYDWLIAQDLGLWIIRTHMPMDAMFTTTCAVFYRQGFEDVVEATNEAFMRIKLAWMTRTDVNWQANDFVKCVPSAGDAQ